MITRKEVLTAVVLGVLYSLAWAVVGRGEEPGEQDDTPSIQAQMLDKSNALRASRGLKAHQANPLLMAAAQDQARYMARTRVMSHYTNGGPGGRAARHGFNAGVLENIGYGYQSVAIVFGAWNNSGGHWANMMSGKSEAGFGLAYSADGQPYWCAVYGTPPTEKEEPEPDDEPQAATVSGETHNAKPRLLSRLFRGRR